MDTTFMTCAPEQQIDDNNLRLGVQLFAPVIEIPRNYETFRRALSKVSKNSEQRLPAVYFE